MTMGIAYIEVERPKGWRGEAVCPQLLDTCELDYFEVEVEAEVRMWTENYGADADGNRGILLNEVEVEHLDFTLYGDFRPFHIKVRDYFLLKRKNRNRSRPLKWTQLSDYHFVKIDESVFSASEIEDAEERLVQDAEDRAQADHDEAYEQRRDH